jgi:transcriptional regulator with XRE-family HTH domain
VDVPFVIRSRLKELGLEQRELARAAQVTESYVSQLLARKRAPPAPGRTDIYSKMDRFLGLPKGKLAKLAELQRREGLKLTLAGEPGPLFREVRELILRKCDPAKRRHVEAVFEKQPFGELERLVTQTLLDLVKKVARDELENVRWLRAVARLSGKTYAEMRVVVLEFLDTDIFHLSAESCVAFLDPLIKSWRIDLTTFEIEIVLNPRVTSGRAKRFQFVERSDETEPLEEAGFRDFLADGSLSGTMTHEEGELLKRLTFADRRPTALYYYRELQNLRDPLHFRTP